MIAKSYWGFIGITILLGGNEAIIKKPLNLKDIVHIKTISVKTASESEANLSISIVEIFHKS